MISLFLLTESVCISDVLTHLITLLHSTDQPPSVTNDIHNHLSPRHTIAHLLQELASGNAYCRQTLCKVRVYNFIYTYTIFARSHKLTILRTQSLNIHE